MGHAEMANNDDSLKSRDSIPTRETLLYRIKDISDNGSWLEFYSIYESLILNCAKKHGLSNAEARDALQETMIAVAEKIKSFEYSREKGRFKGWLMTIARRKIADQFRKRLSMQSLGREDIPFEGDTAFEGVWEAEWKNCVSAEAVERLKRSVSPHVCQIFLLCMQGRDPKDVARILGISVPAVYLAKFKATRVLQKQLKQLRKGLANQEIES